ncbi:cis-aconitate decarboxylase [Arthrobacter sp. Hiyo4]|nr:cis-aconitate decarboxylase [Arthrobacter sp. Hiyo4]
MGRDQGGTAQADAVGVQTRLPAAQAAFVNGVLAHSLDYDDTHLPSVLHPSASVIPAVLAAAQAGAPAVRN